MKPSGPIKDAVRQFVLHRAQDKGLTHVDDDESLIENGVVDSLGVFKLVAFLEESFSVQIPDGEIVYENFATIDQIERFVSDKLGRKG
jgi:acyl carrier protein